MDYDLHDSGTVEKVRREHFIAEFAPDGPDAEVGEAFQRASPREVQTFDREMRAIAS